MTDVEKDMEKLSLGGEEKGVAGESECVCVCVCVCVGMDVDADDHM